MGEEMRCRGGNVGRMMGFVRRHRSTHCGGGEMGHGFFGLGFKVGDGSAEEGAVRV